MSVRAALGALSLCFTFAVAAQPRALSIDDALRRADEVSPALVAAHALRDAAEAELTETNALVFRNPEVEAEGTRRLVPQPGLASARVQEWRLGLSQTFETGGQAGHRRASAAAARDALALGVPDARRRLRADVEQRFYRTLSLQLRVAIEREAQAIAEEAAALAGKRVAAGEDSRLDGNLARIEAERARNQAAGALDQLTLARADLAALLQWPASSPLEVAGSLAITGALLDRDKLVESVAARPDLRALARRVEAARRRVELERAAVSPDVTLGLSQGREGLYDARESFTRLTLSVPLPLFRRNEAAIGKAMSELTQAESEHRAALSAASVEIASLAERHATLAGRAQRLQAQVLPAVEENLRLARRAREAGEIAVLQLLLVSRQAIDARRELLDAQTELRLVASALAAALAVHEATP